ncbi:MAG TPA: hypothetical protein VHK69_10395 [Chitinophagaceae bacterium]|nr:hypothetical protein [Chitinophagaceae bacterium]
MLRSLLIVALLPLLVTCKKEGRTCKGHCVEINVSGRAFDAATGIGFNRLQVTVHWKASFTMGGLAPAPEKVFSGKTDENGFFSFVITVDTTLFARNHLSVQVPVRQGYLRQSHNHQETYLFHYDPGGLARLSFEQYPKADLTLRLRRTGSGPFLYFSVEHFYTPRVQYSDLLFTSVQQARDTVIRTETAAHIPTYIRSVKTAGFGSYTEKIDSIRCLPGRLNSIEITY